MDLPPDLLQRTPEEAARRIALGFLDEAHAAGLRLDDDGDAEALHDFRVAIRRLRSTLRAWRDELDSSIRKRHRKALRALQGATGGGRDAEVALLWLGTLGGAMADRDLPALTWLIERLETRRAAAMDHVCADVRKAFGEIEDDLRQALQSMRVRVNLSDPRIPQPFAAAVAEGVEAHLDELTAHLGKVRSLHDEEEAHQSRIRGKRLRYLVEPLRRDVPEAVEIVKRCKKLQDVLGDLNDTNVQTAELARARGEAGAEVQGGLDAIGREIERRRRDLFAELERAWLTDGAEGLTTACGALVRRLDDLAAPDVEIERKYLLRSLPALPSSAAAKEIDQGWLPGDRLRERLRRIRGGEGAVRYLRTVKLGQGVQRFELEEETTGELFEALWPLTEGCRVRKRRHRVADGDLVWEIDEFLDRELFLAEVELDDPGREVEPPAWLAPHVVRDVTGSPEYVNLNLAK